MTNPIPGVDFAFTVWDAVNMERKLDELGTVTSVSYLVTRFKDNEQASVYGSVTLDAPKLNTGIPYAQLTKETVTNWVKAHFGDEKVTEIEAALDQQISEKLAPTHSAGVPWS